MKKYVNKKNIILVSLILIFSVLFVLSFLLKFKSPVEFQVESSNNVITSLKSNDVLISKFTSKVEDLESIKIKIKEGPSNISSGSVFVSIYDYNNELIYYNNLQTAEYLDNTYFCFDFDKVEDSLNKDFTIKIEAVIIDEDNPIEIYGQVTESEESNTTINGVLLDEDIYLIQTGYAVTYFYKIFFIIVLLVLAFIFFRVNFFKNEKFKEKLLKHKFVFVLEFILSFIAAFSMLKLIYAVTYFYNFSILWFSVFTVSILPLIFILSIYIGDKKLTRQDLFLLLATPIVSVYFAFIIPLYIPDEIYHYKIAYQLSLGKIFNSTVSIPTSITSYGNYYDLLSNIYAGSYDDVTSINAGKYNPLLYVFSSVGILVFRLLNFPPLVGFYAGRFVNTIVFLIVGYYVVKKIPFGKLTVIFYLLGPMFVHQAISFSADAMINIFSMLFIAYVLYIKYDKKKIDKKDFLSIFLSLLFVIIGKYAYFLLALLLILIRKELLEFIKNKSNRKIIIMMLIIIIVVLFGWIYSYNYIISTDSVNNYEIIKASDSKLLRIIKNPFNMLNIYYNTLYTNAYFYLYTSLGGSLGLLNISINMIYIVVYLALLILSAIIEKNKFNINKENKIINVIIYVLTFNIILFGLYLGWGLKTDIIIQGVQGRYFLPINILLLLLINFGNKLKDSTFAKKLETILPILLVIIHVLVITDVIKFFK